MNSNVYPSLVPRDGRAVELGGDADRSCAGLPAYVVAVAEGGQSRPPLQLLEAPRFALCDASAALVPRLLGPLGPEMHIVRSAMQRRGRDVTVVSDDDSSQLISRAKCYLRGRRYGCGAMSMK